MNHRGRSRARWQLACLGIAAILLLMGVWFASRESQGEGNSIGPPKPDEGYLKEAPPDQPGRLGPELIASEVRDQAETFPCRVLEMASGEPLREFTVRLVSPPEIPPTRDSGAERSVRTDSRGEFQRRRSETIFLPSEGEWTILRTSVAELNSGADVLAFRHGTVRGRVLSGVPGRPIDMRTVSLTLALTGLIPEWARAVSGPETSLRSFLGSQGTKVESIRVGVPDMAGEFSARVPLLPGLGIVAFADGWRPCHVEVPCQVGSEDRLPDLVLQPAIALRGVVRSTAGLVPGRARVVAYVTRSGCYGAFPPDEGRLLRGRGGLTSVRSLKDDTSRLTLISDVEVREGGVFSLGLNMEGQVRILIYAPGHRLAELELGEVDSDRTGLEVFIDPALGNERLAVHFDGRPVAGLSLVVSDQDNRIEQPSWTYRTDANGTMATGWLKHGTLYAIVPIGAEVPDSHHRAHYLRWRGEREFDLALLPLKRPE